jgi:hypothetical protein
MHIKVRIAVPNDKSFIGWWFPSTNELEGFLRVCSKTTKEEVVDERKAIRWTIMDSPARRDDARGLPAAGFFEQ